MHQQIDIKGLLGTATTSLGTIIGWQSELEFGLRILSLLIGVIVGIYTILHYARANKK